MTTQAWTLDMIHRLEEDHRALERLLAELEAGGGGTRHRRDLADTVIAELLRHSVAEEEYLYPTAREVLPDGNQVAQHEISRHADAEDTMRCLEGVPPDDPRFGELCRKLAAEIRHHMRDEERDLFPRLRQACSEEQLMDLGRKIEMARTVAPARLRPGAADRAPWNTMLGPGTDFVDRLRDAMTGRRASAEDLGRRPARGIPPRLPG